MPRAISDSASATRPIHSPDTLRRTLRYTENRVITGSSGALALYSFGANALYDPNITGTGHQPLAFDQYMALYSVYHVLACRVTLNLYNQTTVPAIAGAAFALTPTGPSDAAGYVETGQCVFRLLPADLTTPVRLTATVNNAMFVNKRDYNDDASYGGNVVANPANVIYCNVFVQDSNATSTATVQVLATLDYDVVFSAPRSLSGS